MLTGLCGSVLARMPAEQKLPGLAGQVERRLSSALGSLHEPVPLTERSSLARENTTQRCLGA